MSVPRRTLLAAAWFGVSVLSMLGQSPSSPPFASSPLSPPLPRNYLDIPPVPGAAFTATVVVELERYYLEDADPFTRTISLIARDAKGRTHNEVRRLMSQSFHGTPQILAIRIFDPATHIEIAYDPARHAGTRQIRPDLPKPFSVSNPEMKTEDLGTSTMNGLLAKGTRRSYTIPKKASGWGKPALMEQEDWTSEEMHLSLLVKRSDERAGALTIGISNLKREEPQASMFEVPAGYQIQDVATPAEAPAAAGVGGPGGRR